MIRYSPLIILFIALFTLAVIIVVNNRSNDKLVSNFVSLLFLGVTGLLISAFVSLKSEVSTDEFGAVLFTKQNPLSLPLFQYNLKTGRVPTITMTNSLLNHIESDSILKTELLRLKTEQKSKWREDLFIRHIVDLLISKYQVHWYYESLHLKMPGLYSSENEPIDFQKEKTEISWAELQKIFPDNFFMSQPYVREIPGDTIKTKLTVPNGIKLRQTEILNGQELIFENCFIEFKISISRMHNLGSNVDSKISKAFDIKKGKETDFMFYPFKIKTQLTKKKLRSGHPEMPEYEYWANDLINHLRENISIDNFWRIIDLNQD